MIGILWSVFPIVDSSNAAVGDSTVIQMPVEVVGADGTTVNLELLPLAAKAASQVRGLRMRIHGLEYAEQASVRINDGNWISISNSTVAIAEPGRSFGGIGGGFATLDLTLPLAGGIGLSPRNRLAFRFNHTDGASSGFRVLSLQFIDASGRNVPLDSRFVEDDPSGWRAPSNRPEDIALGKSLWYSGTLVANGLKGAPAIHAHCGDCHAQDGRDLKYFNYSNASIIARSEFHGLSKAQGTAIASYIRSLPYANPGRPWNPPFQPGPGLSHKPIGDWSAGAGLESVTVDDEPTLRSLFGTDSGWLNIRPEAFAPDGQTDLHEIPIAFQLPDWNHWLPRVHPLDAWGVDFATNPASILALALPTRLQSKDADQFISGGQIIQAFGSWVAARDAFLRPRVPNAADAWTLQMSTKVYATQLWQLVKTWELMQEFGLEVRSRSPVEDSGPDRNWPNLIPLATAPGEAGIPSSPAGMGASALVNEYFNNAWYALQLQVDGSNHGRTPALRVDGIYVLRHQLQLERLSGRAEPGRALLAIIHDVQSTDPSLGPDQSNGWRPNRGIDPRVLVDPDWANVTFAPLSRQTRTQLADSFLAAWLKKTRRYPVASYFSRLYNARSYRAPEDLRNVTGGEVWKDTQIFAAAGVEPLLMRRLHEWEHAYTDMAGRFHY